MQIRRAGMLDAWIARLHENRRMTVRDASDLCDRALAIMSREANVASFRDSRPCMVIENLLGKVAISNHHMWGYPRPVS